MPDGVASAACCDSGTTAPTDETCCAEVDAGGDTFAPSEYAVACVATWMGELAPKDEVASVLCVYRQVVSLAISGAVALLPDAAVPDCAVGLAALLSEATAVAVDCDAATPLVVPLISNNPVGLGAVIVIVAGGASVCAVVVSVSYAVRNDDVHSVEGAGVADCRLASAVCSDVGAGQVLG